jgi:DNA-binding MarR family transcriptional regulator
VSTTTSNDQAPTGGQLNEDELSAWRSFLRTHARVTRALDAELTAAHNLPLSSYEVLLFLENAPENKLRMAELADSVLLSRSGLTRMVDRLEQGGLVRRETCADDLRGFNAVLTEPGRAALRNARRTHLSGVRRLFLKHFTVEEQRLLGSYWERVLDGVDSDDVGPSA